jgi:hypothetical protein
VSRNVDTDFKALLLCDGFVKVKVEAEVEKSLSLIFSYLNLSLNLNLLEGYRGGEID